MGRIEPYGGWCSGVGQVLLKSYDITIKFGLSSHNTVFAYRSGTLLGEGVG